jgi:hypothetical protein
MARRIVFSLVIVLLSCFAKAQDTLPNFTIRDLGKSRIQISWINPFESVVQINVQRSFDSLKGYKTIFSPQSPQLLQNGFVDTKVPPGGIRMYYRIFYVLAGGSYFFSPIKRPPMGVAIANQTTEEEVGEQLITIRLKETIIAQLNFEQYKKFRDSIVYQTRDTLFAIGPTEIVIRPYAAKEMWKPSQYIFTNREGYVSIRLPSSAKHYKIAFFEENGSQLFEIDKIKEQYLTLDKANFFHSGWFYFDLYEDGVLKERNKFFVARDVR